MMKIPNSIPESLVRYDEPIFKYMEGPGSIRTPTDGPNTMQMDDAIDLMLPPREWTDESGTWTQAVNKNPTNRDDVVKLQESLDRKFSERQARATGICPVRDDLYSQAFDELIRQVTLDGPECGLLLLRVRDERKMTIDVYRTLYDSGSLFGLRKQLYAENGMNEILQEVTLLEETKTKLTKKMQHLSSKIEIMEKNNKERRVLEEGKHKEKIDFLTYQGQHLESFLKSMSNSSK